MIKLRYNTKAGDSPLKWRVLDEQGKEFLADRVVIRCLSETTEDVLPSGEIKHHVTCYGRLIWDGTTAIIEED